MFVYYFGDLLASSSSLVTAMCLLNSNVLTFKGHYTKFYLFEVVWTSAKRDVPRGSFHFTVSLLLFLLCYTVSSSSPSSVFLVYMCCWLTQLFSSSKLMLLLLKVWAFQTYSEVFSIEHCREEFNEWAFESKEEEEKPCKQTKLHHFQCILCVVIVLPICYVNKFSWINLTF